MAPGTPNFILLLVILIYTSPPIFIKIGPKLPKLAIGRDEARYWPLDIFANFDSSTEKSSNLIYFIMTGTVIMMISLKLKNGRRFEFDRSNYIFL